MICTFTRRPNLEVAIRHSHMRTASPPPLSPLDWIQRPRIIRTQAADPQTQRNRIPQAHRSAPATTTTQEPRESHGPQRIPLPSTHSTGGLLPSIHPFPTTRLPPPVLRAPLPANSTSAPPHSRAPHRSSGRRRLVHFPQLPLFHPPHRTAPTIIPHRLLRDAMLSISSLAMLLAVLLRGILFHLHAPAAIPSSSTHHFFST
nr:unnamed protein product [Digitaria exilis]